MTTTTISRQQHDYAVEQVRRAGLTDRVMVLKEDYRALRGRYDKLVSIEMIEAVGRHFGTFFAKCSELLTPHGAMLLHAVTIDDRAYHLEKASRSFMNSYIFPGGCLPSLAVIMRQVARRTDMQATGPRDVTPHYVETLRRWRRSFSGNAHELAERGYDQAFPPAVDALPCLLRGRIRGEADLRCLAPSRQAPVPDRVALVPGACRRRPGVRALGER